MPKERSTVHLNRAAQLAGVHRTTIFRAIQRGELTASKLQQDGHKPQYFLDSKQFEQWLTQRAQVAQDAGPNDPLQDSHDSSPHVHDAHDSPSLPFNELASLMESAHHTVNVAMQQAQEAREESRRLERQVWELQHQLTSYQRALAESAESLHEARALETAARAQLLEEKERPLESDNSDLSQLRTEGTTTRRGWGSRFRVWFLGERTG